MRINVARKVAMKVMVRTTGLSLRFPMGILCLKYRESEFFVMFSEKDIGIQEEKF